MSQENAFPTGVLRDAEISRDGIYRYVLVRSWQEMPLLVNFVMLNPSTADSTADDPTARKCIEFARRWGYGGLIITNLFALRATDPRELRRVADPVGPDNDATLLRVARDSHRVVCAWGEHGTLGDRAARVTSRLRAANVPLFCLRINKGGEPSHPLYLPGRLVPVAWRSPS